MIDFSISDEQWAAINEWKNRHDIEEHNNPTFYHGSCGGGFTYEFYPCGLGVAGDCVCDTCKQRAIEASTNNGYFNIRKYMDYMEEHNGSFNFQDFY